jgi:hypothetical protein
VRRSLLCVALFVAACAALDETAAIDTTIDDTKIKLTAPTGYCPLEPKDWPEFQLVDFTSDGIKNQGERLGYFVDCERAQSWHEGSSKDVRDIVEYQTSLAFRSQSVTPAMLSNLCATLHENDDSAKGWIALLLKMIKSSSIGRFGGAEDSTATYIVVGYENTGCYIVRFWLMKNGEKVYTVSVLTTIKGRLVTVHLSRKMQDMDLLKGSAGDAIKRLLAMSRETAAAFVAANQ